MKRFLIFVGIIVGLLFLVPTGVYACTSDSECNSTQVCVDADNNPATPKTCESAAPGFESCIDFGVVSNGKEQCLGPDGSGIHHTPSGKTIRCKWEYVQSNCYSPFGIDSYGQCVRRSGPACYNSGECDWSPDIKKTAGTCVQSSFPISSPTPRPELRCNYVETMPKGIGPVVNAGQVIKLKNGALGQSGNWQSTWKVTTTGGTGIGTITPGPTYNQASWTVPASPASGQKWTIETTIQQDGRVSVNSCTIDFRFPGSPPPEEPEPVGSFFQTTAGNITAFGGVYNPALPTGEALSLKNSSKNDAGSVLADSIAIPAGSLYSESGSSPGWNIRNYTYSGNTPTYTDYINIVLRNAGYANLTDLGCASGLKPSSFDGKYKFWCYKDTGELNEAMDDILSDTDEDDQINVLIPIGTNSVRLTRAYKFANSVGELKPIIMFVNSPSDSKGLTIEGDLSVDKTNELSAFLAVVHGGVEVDPSVKNLDGVILFDESFNNGDSDDQIKGFGSLLGFGNGLSDSFGRTYPKESGPAEDWTFDGKYLNLFKNVLARPEFFWQELSPE